MFWRIYIFDMWKKRLLYKTVTELVCRTKHGSWIISALAIGRCGCTYKLFLFLWLSVQRSLRSAVESACSTSSSLLRLKEKWLFCLEHFSRKRITENVKKRLWTWHFHYCLIWYKRLIWNKNIRFACWRLTLNSI